MASIPTLLAPAKHRLAPLMARVLVKKLESQAEKTVSGIILPVTHISETQVTKAKVVAVGPGDSLTSGVTVPVSVKLGDVVVVPDYGGTRVKLGEEEVFLFNDEDIVGVLDE